MYCFENSWLPSFKITSAEDGNGNDYTKRIVFKMTKQVERNMISMFK
jgi:hypothetical protein